MCDTLVMSHKQYGMYMKFDISWAGDPQQLNYKMMNLWQLQNLHALKIYMYMV